MINGNLILYFYSQTPLLDINPKKIWKICGDSDLTWVVDRCGDTWVVDKCDTGDTWGVEFCE